MYNCELYSVRRNNSDFEDLKEKLDNVASMLYSKDVRVIFQTDIYPDAKKITKALLESESNNNAPDYFIFANALNATNSSSFKQIFFNFINENEHRIKPDDEHKNCIAKVKISSLGDLGNGYRGYCFKIFERHYLILPQASLTGKDISDLILDAVDKAQEIFDKNSEEFPDGLTFIDKKKAKHSSGFFSSFVPHRDDTKLTKVRKWIVIFAIIVFLCAAGYLINRFLIAPYLNTQVNSEIQEIAYKEDNLPIDDNSDSSSIDWEALKKKNSDIVGWIKLDGTKINYPVLEEKDDKNRSTEDLYYLYRTWEKKKSMYGSIFIDFRSTDSVNSKNVIIHGHNMIDGSMFHSLVDYGGLTGDLSFYKKHPTITFNTPQGDSEWKIISVFKTNTLYEHGEFFNYMQGEFTSDAEFMNFVYNMRIRSLFNIPVMVNEDDQIITLSTCSYEFTYWRTVVVARKVRPGESNDVDTDIATLNNNPVFPDVYYSRYGGTRPTVSTFKKAYANGLINWYDGKGDLIGDETLTGTVAANPTESSSKTSSPAGENVTFYTVTFVNYDGSVLETKSVQQGQSVSLPSTIPTMPDDDYYTYTFAGWKTDGLDLNNVQYSMTIAPDFKAVPKE